MLRLDAMSRLLHFLVIVVLVVAGAAVLTAVAFRVWLGSDGGQRWLGAELGRRAKEIGLKVRFRRLSGPLLWGAELDQLTVASLDGKLRAKVPHADLRWSPTSVIAGHPALRVRLVQPSVRLSGRPALRVRPPERATIEVTIEKGRMRGRSLHGVMRASYSPEGGELHAKMRWGRDRATVVGKLHRGQLEVNVADFRMTPSLARAYLPPWIDTPKKPLSGHLTAHGPLDRVRIGGVLRIGRGRAILHGQAALRTGRARLRIAFQNLEPDLLASQEHMVLSGGARVTVRHRSARFVVAGRYHHRRPDVQVPGAVAISAGGTLHGSGTLRARRTITGQFVIRVRDRGHASRLTSPTAPPQDLILRGAYEKPFHLVPALRLKTESK